MSDVHTLAIDIGGTGLKASVLDQDGKMVHDKVWQRTPVDPSPRQMVEDLKALTAPLPPYDRISIGFPGAVRRGNVLTAPHFPNPKWAGFDLAGAVAAALGKPARLGNDADIQGLGVVTGQGIEAVLTLGTGAGTAFFEDGVLAPHMEFAHHPVHGKHDYNGYVGRDALAKVGHKRWNRRVHKVIAILDSLVHFDLLYIGGGNGSKVDGKLGDRVKIVPNEAGITGGIKLWRDAEQPNAAVPASRPVDADHPTAELVRPHSEE
jgi:polyphosphate glucokinase